MAGYSIMHALGQFPVPWRYVRLKIDGEDHGVYLQLHHPVDALRCAQVELASVVRRRKDFFRGEVNTHASCTAPRALTPPIRPTGERFRKTLRSSRVAPISRGATYCRCVH